MVDIIISVLCPFGAGTVVGVIFGITLMGLMHSASEDSRERERTEEWEDTPNE